MIVLLEIEGKRIGVHQGTSTLTEDVHSLVDKLSLQVNGGREGERGGGGGEGGRGMNLCTG